MKSRIAAVAVLVAFAACAPVQAQTPEIDELLARAEAGDAEAQYIIKGVWKKTGGDLREGGHAVRWKHVAGT